MTAVGAAAPVSAHAAWDTPERRELRAMVRRFTEREVVPHLEAWEDAGELPRALHRRAGELGLLALGSGPMALAAVAAALLDISVYLLARRRQRELATQGLQAEARSQGRRVGIGLAQDLGMLDVFERGGDDLAFLHFDANGFQGTLPQIDAPNPRLNGRHTVDSPRDRKRSAAPFAHAKA